MGNPVAVGVGVTVVEGCVTVGCVVVVIEVGGGVLVVAVVAPPGMHLATDVRTYYTPLILVCQILTESRSHSAWCK